MSYLKGSGFCTFYTFHRGAVKHLCLLLEGSVCSSFGSLIVGWMKVNVL